MNHKQQVKSKKRVADHGEVFTNEREVNAMLDLVGDMFIQIDRTFLEPACGDGNFLIEILRRKLSLLTKYRRSSRANPHCERYGKGLVQAVCSLYGVDLLPDNVDRCRTRLFHHIESTNPTGLKKSSSYHDLIQSIDFILRKNIICGNALDYKTSSNQPIVFTHWAMQTDNYVIQNLFSYQEKAEASNTLYSVTRITPQPPKKHYLKLYENAQ